MVIDYYEIAMMHIV